MSKNDSRLYSYYFDKCTINLYDFNDKELAVRNYVAYMLDRTQRIFRYEGLPDTIPQRMLEYLLQVNGYACFAQDEDGKLYAFYGGLGGEPDVYYRPTLCVVANPALKLTKTYKIDEDCVIVRNDSYLYGLLPLFRRYATAMAENDVSFKLASINTRIQSLLSAPDDATQAGAEKYLRDIENGKLGVIAENGFLDGIKVNQMTQSMRTFTDLIEYQQYLRASWYNEIGLNANYNMKREKLSTTESQMNNDALLPLVDDMLQNRKECLEKVNAMFGTNITVEFDSSWEKLLQEFESNQLDGMETEVTEVTEETVETEGSRGDLSGTEDSEQEQRQDGELAETNETVSDVGDGDGELPNDSDTGGDVEVNIEINVGESETVEVDTSEVSEDDESDGSISEDDDD